MLTDFRERLSATVVARYGESTLALETLIEAAAAQVSYAGVLAAAIETEKRKTKRAWLFQQRALALLRAADCCRRLELEPGERHGPTLAGDETHGPQTTEVDQ